MKTAEVAIFSVADVLRLAAFVERHLITYDISGSMATDGLRYCTGCGNYEQKGCKKLVIHHDPDCIYNIVKDVRTGHNTASLSPNED